MPNFKKKPQMTSAEFTAALREAGFRVAQGWIVDVSAEIRRQAAASAERG
jgi:hypothetical protein